MSTPSRPLHLPWHQAECYWLCILPRADASREPVTKTLAQLGLQRRGAAGSCFLAKAATDWSGEWARIYAGLQKADLLEHVDAVILPGNDEPDADYVEASRRPLAEVQAIADSLWLGEAMRRGDVLCYLQPIVSGRDKVFGYESFARARNAAGEVVSGGEVIRAARALGMEFAIDRQLHVRAIETFVESGFSGFLFVNFFPGFIHRPEVYLEGLSETVRAHGVVPKHIVMDITHSEDPRHLQQVQRICDYCRSKGYAVALDDIASEKAARSWLAALQPDYLRLDMKLVQKTVQNGNADIIRTITELCHAQGTLVIAEGVETQDAYDLLRQMKVDLFQGYFFGPPMPVEAVVKKAG